ncbi:hypothetical protein GF336_05445 [Candidatus Woesearchaeota archaeon]|nr:hypothetical protein [Candidatus Woesearchaeota archaeon]
MEKKLDEILERVKTIDTKVEYLIESLSDMRQYYRIEDLWEKDNLG